MKDAIEVKDTIEEKKEKKVKEPKAVLPHRVKGSQESKDYMANLRAMRKPKAKEA